MANILLVSESKSFIISSVIEQLEGHRHKLLQPGNNPSEIGKIKEELNGILMIVDEKLMKEMKLLVYLKDRAIEEDIPFFLLGDSEKLVEIEYFYKSIFHINPYKY